MAITCCAEDMSFLGFACEYKEADKLKEQEWVKVTATVSWQYWKEYNGEGPILHAVSVVSTKAPKKTVIDFSSNPHLNNDVFKSKIGLLNAMSDDEIFALLNVCYPSILEDINSNKFEYVKAYINPRFINQFARIIATTEISLSKKKACCRLAYLYHIAKSANKNEVIEKLYTILAKFSCRDIVPILCGKGIPEKMAIDLAIARYSNDNEIINVRRVNFIIQNGPIDIINTQHIVWIYEVLFDRVTPLFKGTMFNTLIRMKIMINFC